MFPVGAQCIEHEIGRELAGKGEGQAQLGGQLGTEGAGAQQPDRYVQTSSGHGAQTLARLWLGKQPAQLIQHLRKVRAVAAAMAQRLGRGLVGTRRAPQAQVDPTRVQ